MADTENKPLLKMLQERFTKYHPVIAMAEMAHEDNIDDRIRFDCHKEISKYVEPQLKAVEHKGSVKSDFGTLRVIQSTESLPPPTQDNVLEHDLQEKITVEK